jgi:surfeit locus 1 family protein
MTASAARGSPRQVSASVTSPVPIRIWYCPPGVVKVQGRIAIPAAGYLELKPETASGSIRQNLDPARFAAATGLAVLPAVIEATVAPVPDDGLLRDWPAPDFGIETHRIYMVQWYAFALLAAALWLWFHRPRGARERHG